MPSADELGIVPLKADPVVRLVVERMARRRSQRPRAGGARRAARLRRLRPLLRGRAGARPACSLPLARRPRHDPLRALAGRVDGDPEPLGLLPGGCARARSSSADVHHCPDATRHARSRRDGRHDGAIRPRYPLAAGIGRPAAPALGSGRAAAGTGLSPPLRRSRRTRRDRCLSPGGGERARWLAPRRLRPEHVARVRPRVPRRNGSDWASGYGPGASLPRSCDGAGLFAR